MTASLESTGNSYVTDRRSERRQKVLFSSVVISETNCGRVLDISPKGLALQTDSALVGDEFPNFRFKFSPTLAWVAAKGRVVWKNESKNVVGIEFVGLTDEVHRQIQTWMDSKKDLSGIGAVIVGPTSGPRTISAPVASVLPPPTSDSLDPSVESQRGATVPPPFSYVAETPDVQGAAVGELHENIPGRTNKVPWLIGLALLIALLLTPYALRRFQSGKSANSQKTTQVARTSQSAPATPQPGHSLPSAARPSVAPSQPTPPAQSVAPPKPATPAAQPPAPTSNRRTASNAPAFVVQVGAMIHQENANALAASLRERNFPAFVMKLPTDRFHYVLVGPYDSKSAAVETQNNLEQNGYKSLRREWKVSSR
jgi:SPOR domain/PilZ domain